MKNNKITISYPSTLAVVIFLVFFIAKIYDKIDWSWWWIFSPLWLPLAVVLSLLAITTVVHLIILIIEAILEWK